jgi:hypothetical protein
MARLTTLPDNLKEEIVIAWNGSMSKMFDNERTLASLYIPMAEEINTQWYSLGNGSFMLLRNAIVGGSANLQFISPDGETIPQLESARDQLVDAMKQYRLKRINVTYPTVLPWRDFKLLGFKHEGRIRKSVLFDGEWIDAEILGALENEIGISRRRRRKRYRTKKESVNAERLVIPATGNGASTERSKGRVPSEGSSGGDAARSGPNIKPQYSPGPVVTVGSLGLPRATSGGPGDAGD